jgi:LDH2 family malate/lactate/ureidoglycolate dehydrogenase
VASPIISVSLNGSQDAPNNVWSWQSTRVHSAKERAFTQAVGQLCSAIKSLPSASENEKVLLPGEGGFAELDKRKLEGIPVSSRLIALAKKTSVSVPASIL